MRIISRTNVTVVGKGSNYSESSKKTYFTIAVLTDSGEAGNISCTEDTFKAVPELFKPYELTLSYNDQYRYMQATAARLLK